jgi:hypothetical protein
MMRNLCLIDGDWIAFLPEATTHAPPEYDVNVLPNGVCAAAAAALVGLGLQLNCVVLNCRSRPFARLGKVWHGR